jgi:alpha-glucosidase
VVPATWDETHVLAGEIGAYVAIARRRGDDWFVGAMTDEPRELLLSLERLGPGPFQATVYADAADSGEVPTHVDVSTKTLEVGQGLSLTLAQGGGAAVRLTPAR